MSSESANIIGKGFADEGQIFPEKEYTEKTIYLSSKCEEMQDKLNGFIREIESQNVGVMVHINRKTFPTPNGSSFKITLSIEEPKFRNSLRLQKEASL